ncbi:saccharopine dehydrogenase [Mangrovimicrobium sediminis]|uniref:Saccharopine dehydrogenase n=2 Tax=Mangrovimicrobium sediminis TaxID=2562682 RepID=A0A4Z0M5I9_9GAMM|nr:saccharopine dehydrogenase [Haliea sp. SAOS-164]
MSDAPYDMVLFGATSFVGKITARYLLETYGVNGEGGQLASEQLRWAIAARSETKLEQLCDSLGEAAAHLPRLVVDAGNEEQLRNMCERAAVVVSTVGPYALYGEPLVRCCVETGTDYCDLTGEVQWVRRMIFNYEEQARASGARIVHCCGFDSIPSDLGVYFLQQQAKARFGAYCTRVSMRVKALRGGMSGGTLASLFNVLEEAGSDSQLRKELSNPYSLCPDDFPRTTRQHPVRGAQFDANFGRWVIPFLMAPINERVVLRSNALAASHTALPGMQPYGEDFQYNEAMMSGYGFRGRLTSKVSASMMSLFTLGAALGPTRSLMQKLLPSPGEGPSEEAQGAGFYDLRFCGETAGGEKLYVKVTGDRDPGYGGTAKMLGQAAVALARDFNETERVGGFWTPAAVFGEGLIRRLTACSGMCFEVVSA